MREVSKLSKSILVIDTPEKCEDCIFFYQYNKDDVDSAYCRAFEEEKKTSIMWKPDWCPLKEIPKKRNLKKCMMIIYGAIICLLLIKDTIHVLMKFCSKVYR